MKLTRDELESVFDELGRRALAEGRQLDIAVYEGFPRVSDWKTTNRHNLIA